MELENYKTAINHLHYVVNDTTNLYTAHAKWYLSLCYLDSDNKILAKQHLKDIINSESQYKLKAEKILKKIK